MHESRESGQSVAKEQTPILDSGFLTEARLLAGRLRAVEAMIDDASENPKPS